MGLINFILLILIFLLMLAFTVALKIKLKIDTNNEDLDLTILWLYPFIKALVTIENTKPMLTLYVFKVKVFRMAIKAKKGNKGNGSKFLKLVKTTDIDVTTSYGFKDLYLTGVVCGVINMIKGLINSSYVRQFPNFMAQDDYIYINATAKVNIGTTLVNLTKNKIGIY